MSKDFETAFFKRAAGDQNIKDAIFAFLDAIERNPRALGEVVPLGSDAEHRVYESPRIGRVPSFGIVYEIDDKRGVVTCHSFMLVSDRQTD